MYVTSNTQTKRTTTSIVQIGPYPLSSNCIKGGVESSVFGLSKELAKNNIVDVFDCPRINGMDSGERYGNLTIHRYKNNGIHNQDSTNRVNEIIRDIVAIGPDVCHVHGTNEFSAAIYYSLVNYGYKVILTVHGLLNVEKRNLLVKHPSFKYLYQFIRQSRIEFKLLSNIKNTIVDTAYVQKQIEHYHQSHKIANHPITHIIPQGINDNFTRIKCSNDSRIILSVGAISRRKGHLLLLKSFDLACKSDNNLKLIIAGSLADKKYYGLMLKYIDSSPNKNNIEIKTDLSQNELFALFEQSHIFAIHSEEESQGIAIVEAMATGLPIVATNVGGIPDVVQNSINGILTNYGDIKEFGKSISLLMSDNNIWQQYSHKSREKANDYTWENIATRIERLYNSL